MASVYKWKDASPGQHKRQVEKDIVAAIDSLVGLSYSFGQMDVTGPGTDCLGMIHRYLNSLVGYKVPNTFEKIVRSEYYQFCIDYEAQYIEYFERYLLSVCSAINVNRVVVGDIAILSNLETGESVVGIVKTPSSVLLCVKDFGVVSVSAANFFIIRLFRGMK